MIEKIGNQDIFVRNYTSNINVKEFIQEVLIPKAFPDIPINKLNIGLTGITSEYIGQGVEDAFGTASLMMNESFITKAELPSSIYAEASTYDLGYTFATPSRCNFAVQLWLDDIIKYATRVSNTLTMRYKLDKNTKVILGDNTYRFDYDIIIDFQYIDGNRVFNVYYDTDENNSISMVGNKYVKHQVTSIGWLVLFVTMQEFERKVIENAITDNLITVNSDISLKWDRQIAGLDLVYITPTGDRVPMKLKNQHTNAEQDPFAWYTFFDDNTIRISFSNSKGFFQPAFNSKVESTIYICSGATSNFDSYDRKTGVPVQKSGEKFEYNANTRMVALCYSGSTGGLDKGDIEDLRQDVIVARNTVNVLTTDNDLKVWFAKFAQRYGTQAEFFKRRDDPAGTLFSQFIAITNGSYTYPSNTLAMDIEQSQFDYVNNDSKGNNNEFIIKPGHLWEYADYDEFKVDDHGNPILDAAGNKQFTGKRIQVRDRVRMVTGTDAMAMVTDEAFPAISSDRPFMFVNPFYIKIHKNPNISACYNCLLNHTSWPEDVPIASEIFYKFQLATLSVERDLSKEFNNKYKIQVICVPVVSSTNNMRYIAGVGDEYPIANNNLRLVLITRSKADGETGYIEMKPVEQRTGDAILFEATISVHDNLRSDMTLEIDLDKTPGVKSLITSGVNSGKVLLDSAETSFHFAAMMKDFTSKSTSNLFESVDFEGYVMANRFANDHRSLTLYNPMTMMRSNIVFAGKNNDYKIRTSLIPFLKYDIPLDSEKMAYFIQAFNDQYAAMQPALKKLNGNSHIDFKLFNTYGRSNNYYIGPEDGSDILWNSNILLDNVYVKIRFKMAVYDRSLYTQTVKDVSADIIAFFASLSSGTTRDIHISNITSAIEKNHPNVHYIRFLGFNDYDATKQSIFTKYDDISELCGEKLQIHVPEMIRVDSSSIDITEEV